MQAAERLDNFVREYGVEVVNLIVKRHHLSTEKRLWFSVRFVEEDPEIEKKHTKEMDNLSEEIKKIDVKLSEAWVDSKLRTQVIRDIKKVYPESWENGFVEEI